MKCSHVAPHELYSDNLRGAYQLSNSALVTRYYIAYWGIKRNTGLEYFGVGGSFCKTTFLFWYSIRRITLRAVLIA